jgi:periplasmic protein TonB
VAPLAEIPDSLCPWPISVPEPQYPSNLAQAGIDGLVQLRYIIEADGRVAGETIEVLWASEAGFIPPAKKALSRGRFRPARWEGTPVRTRVYQNIRFRVHGERPRWN